MIQDARYMIKGQSLVEILVSIGIIAIVGASIIGAISAIMRVNLETKNAQVASGLIKKTIDEAKGLAESDWSKIYNLSPKGAGSQFYPAASGATLTILSGATTTIIGAKEFTYWFSVENTNRTKCGLGDITTSATTSCSTTEGAGESEIYEDPFTQKITTYVSWQSGSHQITVTQYISRKRNLSFLQTDWSGGYGQEIFATTTSGTIVNNKFSTSTNVSYSDSGKLIVTSPSSNGFLISSTYDTFSSKTGFNTIMWQGTKPSGTNVKFQIAVSDSSDGPWSYSGPDDSVYTYYTPTDKNQPIMINPRYHNQKRYLRYKVFLMPGSGAETGTGPIDSTNRWAWNDNIGWIDFGYSSGDVHVNDTDLTGYAWNNNAKEIVLNCATTPIGSVCNDSDFKVARNSTTGVLSGWAWSDDYGWISFNSANNPTPITCDPSDGYGAGEYCVTVSTSTGVFSGWAWNDNLGWISFNCADPGLCASSDYKVSVATASSTPEISDISINWSP